MSKSPPPALSPQERQAALEKAKESRKDRAEVKRLIALGEMNIFDAISDPRESIRRMRVFDLLSALPGVGKARAGMIMERRNISATRRIGGLGHLQQNALGKELAVTRSNPVRGNLVVISGPGGVGMNHVVLP